MNPQTPTVASPLATPAESNSYLRVGRTTLYKLMESGEITRVKIGSKTFVTVASMDAYIERLEDAARTGAA
ncbi:helix-turn-helix domain-containing protein [Mycobacterium hodleri]|uniref:helix-turn-helix domain-containing protein n=1 Tax=Mycolicibacterium hodleri TaxID=49897 RepID=UPI0021F35BEF|nr:helix-turn-helix domain-containing protein [Mycolicibacterium hodleri]MCV7134420.1 helix-turn-helix domain-containing protein [Mycolicibacterium hodleri]